MIAEAVAVLFDAVLLLGLLYVIVRWVTRHVGNATVRVMVYVLIGILALNIVDRVAATLVGLR